MKRKYRIISRMTYGKITYRVEVKTSYFYWILTSGWESATNKSFDSQEDAERWVVDEITEWADYYKTKLMDDEYGVKKHGEYE
jgi:hypothetical protein